MFKDRVVLIEQEISKLKERCGKLYRSAVIEGAQIDNDEYTKCLEKITTMTTELALIKEMIAAGQE